MPIIKPVSDLRNNFNEISELCHKEEEPVFITKNGQGDMVVMSLALYEKQQALIELYQKLSEAEFESASGAPGLSHGELMKQVRSKIK
ncbi:MAG: type II toxin-antitoxin system Phd/YefM family antitoxin [Nitrospirae bacterium]|nr:type II toxin-antitoxin system Phd/YefM family antitoxin [Nitrospirota bacterium]